ncbi:hypothetical protein HDU67_010036 [Dinochytrium kinnereticum]|nr:hypothetical protein HDU67_010036 [Dinochytrium kinnereticum]
MLLSLQGRLNNNGVLPTKADRHLPTLQASQSLSVETPHPSTPSPQAHHPETPPPSPITATCKAQPPLQPTQRLASTYFQELASKQEKWASEKARASEEEMKKAIRHRKEAQMVAERIYCDPELNTLVSRLVVASSWSKVMPNPSWSISLPSLPSLPSMLRLGSKAPTNSEEPPGHGRPEHHPPDAVSSAIEALAVRANAGDWAAMWLLDDPDVSTVADSNAMVGIGYVHAWGRLKGGCPTPMHGDETSRTSLHLGLPSPGGSMDLARDSGMDIHRNILGRACGWFRKAAMLENREAMVALGRLLICSGDDPGLGITWLIKGGMGLFTK